MGKLREGRILRESFCALLMPALKARLTSNIQGVLSHYFRPSKSVAGSPSHPVPVDLLVTGSVPAGSGLSSSAAMVVASTLAFLAVNGLVRC